MIRLHGATRRAFFFPAEVRTAWDHFSDFRRVVGWLPHLQLVKAYDPTHFRVLYHTTELGIYDVRIYCDLSIAFDAAGRVLRVRPFPDPPPVRSRVTPTSLTAQGLYASDSVFRPIRAGTQIEYRLRLSATLPKPTGLGLVPESVLERVAGRVVVWRMREIADGFVVRSLDVFGRDQRR